MRMLVEGEALEVVDFAAIAHVAHDEVTAVATAVTLVIADLARLRDLATLFGSLLAAVRAATAAVLVVRAALNRAIISDKTA